MYVNIFEDNGRLLWTGTLETEVRTAEFIQCNNKIYKVTRVMHQLPIHTYTTMNTNQQSLAPIQYSQSVVIFVKECVVENVLDENVLDEAD